MYRGRILELQMGEQSSAVHPFIIYPTFNINEMCIVIEIWQIIVYYNVLIIKCNLYALLSSQ
jgi:hypothetical protein